ncbi:hypothetical protein C8R46DRAFT_505945 [Mycena filopes]|nr:hypothetical protein C8R46DRAFT_505945 [Mycena filopes]
MDAGWHISSASSPSRSPIVSASAWPVLRPTPSAAFKSPLDTMGVVGRDGRVGRELQMCNARAPPICSGCRSARRSIRRVLRRRPHTTRSSSLIGPRIAVAAARIDSIPHTAMTPTAPVYSFQPRHGPLHFASQAPHHCRRCTSTYSSDLPDALQASPDGTPDSRLPPDARMRDPPPPMYVCKALVIPLRTGDRSAAGVLSLGASDLRAGEEGADGVEIGVGRGWGCVQAGSRIGGSSPA